MILRIKYGDNKFYERFTGNVENLKEKLVKHLEDKLIIKIMDEEHKLNTTQSNNERWQMKSVRTKSSDSKGEPDMIQFTIRGVEKFYARFETLGNFPFD